MDVICPKCGEPWEFDTLHQEAEARYAEQYEREFSVAYKGDREAARREYDLIFQEVSSEWRSIGCAALKHVRGTDEPCVPQRSTRTAMARAAYDVCGDDLDGAASMLEDLGG